MPLPPPPVNDKPGSFTWLEWYRQLRNYVSTSGSVPWYIINFAGSNITDIASRAHNNLQNLQGGASGQMYHLSLAQYNAVLGSTMISSVSTSTALGDDDKTTLVTVTGLTITLPAASAARVGFTWSIILTALGYTTIVVAGSDTIVTADSATDTSVRVEERGTTLNFRCTSVSTWSIV